VGEAGLFADFARKANAVPGSWKNYFDAKTPEEMKAVFDKVSAIEIPDCPICLEYMDDDEVTTECGHAFHRACLSHWLSNHRNCPNCRAPIPIS